MAKYNIPEYRVTVDQLVPGVFVRLDSHWFNHPFLFNKFKIKNAEQIQSLREVGITEVICVPEKSDQLPKSADEVKPRVAAEPEAKTGKPDPYTEELWRIKREQIKRLKEKKESIARCEASYKLAMDAVPGLMSGLLSGKAEAVKQADALATELVEAFRPDVAAVMHLMDIKATDDGIYYHSLNVSVLSLMLGKQLGLTPEEMKSLALGSLLHDIGKSRIEKKILRKPPPLTKAEQTLLQLHPKYGVDILLKAGGFDEDVLRLVFEHHERLHGKGYPRGLAGDKIFKLARIAIIPDVYDNLVNDPDQSRAMTPYQALAVMYGKLKPWLDENYFSAFIRSLGIYPPGTVIQLSNNVIALVISVNPKNPLRPSVLLYDPEIPRDDSVIFDLEDAPELAVVKSLHPRQLPREIFNYLNPRTRVAYFMDSPEAAGS